MNINDLHDEIQQILSSVSQSSDEGHLWEPYQKVTAYLLRLIEIHNQLSWAEIMGEASPQEKKFRTMIVDKAIEGLEKVASYESRKLTAKKMELELDK